MVVAPPSSATAATAAALLAGGAVLLALKWRRSGEGPPEGFPNRVELLEGETSAIMMGGAPSVSAVTFYAGDPESAADWLGRRVAEIVRANPWLAGRLDRRAGDGRPALYYPSDGGGEAFERVGPGICPLRRGTPYKDMERLARQYLVGKGAETVGRPELLFRVSLIPDADAPASGWAMVVSLSHIIADGHTFYRIHGMLNESSQVVSLRVGRKPGAMEAAVETMGGEGEAGFLHRPKPGLLLSLVASTAMGKAFGPKCAVAAFELDEDFVASAKSAAEAAAAAAASAATAHREEDKAEDGGAGGGSVIRVSFVSTNDVITSTICSVSKAEVGTMDINFRGRLPSEGDRGLADNDAGNYEDKIVYRPRDFRTPAMIRRSISSNSSLRRAAVGPPTSLPRTVGDFWKVGMITSVSNWSTFATGVSLEGTCGSRELVHLPLFDPSDVPARVFTGCFVFRAGSQEEKEGGLGGSERRRGGKRLGLAVAARPGVLEAIERCGLVRGRIVR